jgi:hypothetical protein
MACVYDGEYIYRSKHSDAEKLQYALSAIVMLADVLSLFSIMRFNPYCSVVSLCIVAVVARV